MGWIAALIGAAGTYYASTEAAEADERAQGEARGATEAQIREALGAIGWFGQSTYMFTPGDAVTGGLGTEGAARAAEQAGQYARQQYVAEMSLRGQAAYDEDYAAWQAGDGERPDLGDTRYAGARTFAKWVPGETGVGGSYELRLHEHGLSHSWLAEQSDQVANRAHMAALRQPTEGVEAVERQTAFGRLEELYGVAREHMEDRASALESGALGALRSVETAGAQASRDVIREGQQARAAAESQLMSRGLAGTTGFGDLQRASQADTAQSIGRVAEQFAPLRAGAEMQLGEAKARGFEGLATLSQNQSTQEMDLVARRIAALLGVSHEAAPSLLQSLGGAQGMAQWGAQLGSIFQGAGS